jgi:cytochrome-b5 reductase
VSLKNAHKCFSCLGSIAASHHHHHHHNTYLILIADFDLLVKRYEFGKMSTHMHSLRAGSKIEVRGPIGRFKYKKNQYPKLGLIAGGTGLTPCLQVIRSILQSPEYAPGDKTRLTLFFQNRTEEDILLLDELELLVKK